jgi:hypothetical protein
MPKKPKKSLSIIDRRRHVVEMRRTGSTLESIANVISSKFGLPNYDRRRAFDDLKFGLDEINREYQLDTEALRREHLETIDRLQMALWSKAIGGDVKAIDSITRLLGRKSRLCGLDAPVQLLVEKSLDREIELVFQALERSLHHEVYVQVLQIVSSMGEKS